MSSRTAVLLAVLFLLLSASFVAVFEFDPEESSEVSSAAHEIKEEDVEKISILDPEPVADAEAVTENLTLSVSVEADLYPIEVVFYLGGEEIHSETVEDDRRVETPPLHLEHNTTYLWKVEAVNSDDVRETFANTFTTGLEGYYTLEIQKDVLDQGFREQYDNGVDPDRWGTTDPEVGVYEYEPGTNVTVRASPTEGWRFSHWTVGFDREDDPEITIEMDGDRSLTAYFRILEEFEYIGSDKGWYEPGEMAIVEVKNDGTGLNIPILRDFRIYIENLETGEVVHGPFSGGVHTVVPEYGHTESFIWNQTDQYDREVSEGTYKIRAEYRFDHTTEFIIAEDSPMLDLSISVEGQGRVEVSPEKDEYEYGTEVDLKAVPEEGWEFVGWTGDFESPEEEETLTMDYHKSLTAVFQPIRYDLNITINGEGTTNPEQGNYSYGEGHELTVEAIPDEHWTFSHWAGDLSEEKVERSEIEIEMDMDRYLEANFLKEDPILEEDEYIGTEKQWYETGENVTIEVKNDGSAGSKPIIYDFGIYIENLETGEVVHGPLDGVIQPIVPEYGRTEYIIWDQTDLEGEQVPEGTYRVAAERRFDHTTEFHISSDPPEIELSNLDVRPEKVEVGEEVEVRVDVTNLGKETIEYEVQFYIYGPCRWSKREDVPVTVEAGETETVSYNYTAVDKPGEHIITVIENDETVLSTSVEVEDEMSLSGFLKSTWWLIAMMIFVIAIVVLVGHGKRQNSPPKKPVLRKKEEEEGS